MCLTRACCCCAFARLCSLCRSVHSLPPPSPLPASLSSPRLAFPPLHYHPTPSPFPLFHLAACRSPHAVPAVETRASAATRRPPPLPQPPLMPPRLPTATSCACCSTGTMSEPSSERAVLPCDRYDTRRERRHGQQRGAALLFQAMRWTHAVAALAAFARPAHPCSFVCLLCLRDPRSARRAVAR